MLRGFLRLAVAALALAAPTTALAAGETPLTALGTLYSEKFNGTIASSGTANTLVPPGWAFAEAGTNANATYRAGNGVDNAGDTYSFGATADLERAFGGLQSGSLNPTVGVGFQNLTGAIITSLDVGYTGEQWRLGTVNRGPDRLDFQWSTTATGLTDGAWTNLDALDFSSPFAPATGSTGALDGNLPANRLTLAWQIDGLSIFPGQTIWLRWIDFNATNADDGLAVDDFLLTAHGTVVTRPVLSVSDATVTEGDSGTTPAGFTVSLSEPAGAGGVSFDIATSDGTATAASGDYVARAARLTIPEGSSATTFTVDVNGDTGLEPDETFSVDVSNLSGADPGDTHAVGTITNDELAPVTPIHSIQGASHVSPLVGQDVSNVQGIVTQKLPNGFFLQDPAPDADPATSEGIFVFGTISAGRVAVGDLVGIDGQVQEFRPSGTATNLTTTEIGNTFVRTIFSHGNALPAPTTWSPPTETIEDDAAGDVETSGTFDPAQDGLDYAESLEGMRVAIVDATATGPSRNFPSSSTSEVPVVNDAASVRTPRGGVVIRENDFNPERLILQTAVNGLPPMNVGDRIPGATIGELDYNFGNFKLRPEAAVSVVAGGLQQEVTADRTKHQLSVATFNVENLDPGDGDEKFDRLARILVANVKAPDVVTLEEVQDNNGPVDDGTVASNVTLDLLVAAIERAGGPHYSWRYIAPVNDEDGGEPGGNIRVAFLFDAERVAFVDRGDAGPLTPNDVQGSGPGTHLAYSPGRIDPASDAWTTSRKPLAAEFVFRGHKVFVIANHFNSKGGDQPLMGRFQPPTLSSEVQRRKQATEVREFVEKLLTADPAADVVVAGDLNDFQFSPPLKILKGAGLTALIETLPVPEQYTYDFDGNSQAIDHILLSPALAALVHAGDYDVVHVNSEFADQASDHEPQVVRLLLNDKPTVKAGGPFAAPEGGSVTLAATGADTESPETLAYAWDLDGDGTFETAGATPTYVAGDGPATRTVRVRVTDDAGQTAEDAATVTIANVAPTATFTAPASVLVGQPYLLALTGATDPSAADTAAGFAYAFDCGGGYATFQSADVTCPDVTVAGPRVVRAKVADKDGGTTEYTQTVDVRVTAESLCALTQRYVSKEGVAHALCVKLEQGSWTAYANEVGAQSGKALTPDQAAVLVQLASRL